MNETNPQLLGYKHGGPWYLFGFSRGWTDLDKHTRFYQVWGFRWTFTLFRTTQPENLPL